MAELGTLYVDIRGDWDQFSKQVQKNTKNSGSFLRTTLATAVGVGLQAGAAAAFRGFRKTMSTALNFTDLLDRAERSFTLFADGATKELKNIEAKELIKDIKIISETTPFDVDAIVEASLKMAGYGVELQTVRDLLPGIVDAVAAFGGENENLNRIGLALGQIEGKGRVLGEELRQLNEAGVPAQRILAERLGITQGELLKMASAGEVASDLFFAAMNPAVSEFGDIVFESSEALTRAEGAAEEASLTIQGATSNIRDAWKNSLQEGLQPFIREIATLAASDELRGFIRGLGQSMGELIGNLLTGLGQLLPVLQPIAEILLDTFGTVLLNVIDTAVPLLTAIAPILARLAEMFLRLVDAALPLIEAIFPLITTLLDAVLDVMEPLIDVIIEEFIPILTEIFEGPGKDLIDRLLPPLIDLFRRVVPPLGRLIGKLVVLTVDALMPVIEALLPIIDLLLPVLTDLILELIPIFELFAEVVALLLEVGLVPLIQLALGLVEVLLSALIPVVMAVVGVLADLYQIIYGTILRVLEQLRDLWDVVIERFRQGVDDAVGYFSNLYEMFKDGGREMVRGFLEPLRGLASSVVSFFKEAAQKALGAFKAVLGISSPSKEMMKIGDDMVAGLTQGLDAGGSAVTASLSGLVAPGLDMGATRAAAAGAGIGGVTVINNAPVSGSMAEFARQIERQRAISARFAS